jgi:hypothetical protein
MHKGFLQTFLILFLLCGVLPLVFSCHKDTEQDKVKTVITDVQMAAEKKDIKKVIASLSKTYQDPQGFTYDTIKGMLLGYFFRHQKISAYLTNLDVAVNDTAATAKFEALLSGGAKTESLSTLMPDTLGLYAFEVSFKKESGDWKVTSAKWDRIGDYPSGSGR